MAKLITGRKEWERPVLLASAQLVELQSIGNPGWHLVGTYSCENTQWVLSNHGSPLASIFTYSVMLEQAQLWHQ